MSNTVDKYNYVFIVSKPYPCHPYMSITEIFSSENGVPKKSLDTSLVLALITFCFSQLLVHFPWELLIIDFLGLFVIFNPFFNNYLLKLAVNILLKSSLRHRQCSLGVLLYILSSRPRVFLGKSVLKMCSKFTLQFTEIALPHGCSPVSLLHIFRTTFPKNTSGRTI